MELREVTYLAVLLRIVAAGFIGGLIGMDREFKNRPAGLRTYMLVCTGACIIMLTNQYICQVTDAGDPTRMGAQVVSGIGFLGAGTIIVTRRNQIKGLTTAAGLWAAAGVGLALGAGFYEAAIVGSAAVFPIMTGLQKLDGPMRKKSRQVELYLELDPGYLLGDFVRALRKLDMELSNVQREQPEDGEGKVRAYIAAVSTRKKRSHLEVTELIRDLPGVLFLEEL